MRPWHLRTGSIVFAWLLALFAVAVAGRSAPDSYWLLVHLLALGAGSNAILIWSWYFTESVLRLPHQADRRSQAARLALFNSGAAAVVVGYSLGHTSASSWWPVVLGGGLASGTAIVWHAVALLHRFRTSLPSRFGPMVRYYIASGCCLPIGIGLGIAMAAGALPGTWHARFLVAHAAVNVLGWIGLAVLGTLVTLWPTMLHTRMADGVEKAAARGLFVLPAGVAVIAGGALGGLRPLAGAGVLLYLAAVVLVLRPHVDEARRKPPVSFPTLSALSGVAWLIGTLIALAVSLFAGPDWHTAGERLRTLAIPFAVGFLGQVLFGALSYLLPVVLGRRPSATQAATAMLDRAGGARVVATNAALLLCVLPVPDAVRWTCGAVVVVSMSALVPLTIAAVVATHRAEDVPVDRTRAPTRVRPPEIGAGQRAGRASIGLVAVVLAVVAGVAWDPAAAHSGAAPPGTTAGHDTAAQDRAAQDNPRPRVDMSPRDPALPPVGPASVHTVDIAHGSPAPVLHGRPGDTFVVTVKGAHSGACRFGGLATDSVRTEPDATIYRLTALGGGAGLYRCRNGAEGPDDFGGTDETGAIVVNPPGLAPVAREYLLVESTSSARGSAAFNSVPNQYDRQTIDVNTRDRVRIWVVDAGPDADLSFHVVGGQFGTVFAGGRYLLRPDNPEHGGSQVLALAPGQGGFVDLPFPEPGTYQFLDHVMVNGDRGAHGTIRVRN
ncbi:hypothetical protein [Speluncibacter jeojiensis]|uniref:Copper oxidase n=1 Tax=Speluncibacter jeojiensis TaxID=2710754 RepID=A0A9X4M9J5_9ACTN|nr:hypothetical protein [Corynebacteriales bacterium D3-21]